MAIETGTFLKNGFCNKFWQAISYVYAIKYMVLSTVTYIPFYMFLYVYKCNIKYV